MKEKIYNFWNLEEIIKKNIENFKITNNSFRKEENIYTFKFKKVELSITDEYIILNGTKYTSPNMLKLKKEKKFLKEKMYLNSLLLEENAKFLQVLIEEWKENKSLLAEVESTHSLVTLKRDIKCNYIQTLNYMLEKLSPLKIKKDKYIYLIGRALELEERELIEMSKNEANYKKIEDKYFQFIMADILNFFNLSNLDYPDFKEMTACVEELKGYENQYLTFIDFFKSKTKNYNKMEKLFDKKRVDFLGELILQEKLYSNSRELLKVREKKNMKEKLKIEFLRDENEHYYYQFLGEEENKLEYLIGLDEEEQAKIVLDEDKEELDFNEVVKSYDDNEIASELSKKSSLYKKVLKNKKITERKDFVFPKVTYADITEEIILGHLRIKKDYLQTSGIWAFQGERWLEFSFEDLLSVLKEKQNFSLDYNFKLIHYRNTEKEDILNIKKNIRTNWELKETDTNDLKIEFSIDTNYLGEKYLDDDSFVTMDFYFELIVRDNDLEQELIFGVPVNIKLLNPTHKDYTTNEVATIDFGTSSTCVAINDGSAKRRLLSLEEPEERGEQAYENPTNLLIKDWKKFYEIWKDKESKSPIIKRYRNISEDGLYNQGHSLKEQLKMASKTELNAQLNQLKLIPYKNITLKDKVVLIPYIVPKVGVKEIELISEYEKQNEEKFDVISFYGYLLGRVILSPLNKKILKRFYITVPVKFEENVKNSIINSIKNGIRLAVPEPLKDKIKVEEGHEEPVAFIGAICGHETMKNTGWGVNSKFAVFDFGGGTLDFSFGRYRNSNEDIDEELDYDRIIEVVNTAGDEKGGAEYIIHKLSYLLYKQDDNKRVMKEKRIPFIIPEGENEIELFPRDLQSGKTKPAMFNTNILNKISRKKFQGEEIGTGAGIELQDENGSYQTIDLNIEENYLETNLRELLAKQVSNFKKLLFESFKEEKDIYDNLHIFRAGNASRSELLKDILEDEFRELLERENSGIHFIDEESVHGVKPKTAVALGELKLRSSNEIGVVFNNKLDKEEIPFEFNVGYTSPDNDNEFVELVSIGSISKDWKRLGRANKEILEFVIYYTSSIGVEEISNQNMRIFRPKLQEEELENGNIVWIRPVVANKLEYIIARRTPKDSESGKIIELPR